MEELILTVGGRRCHVFGGGANCILCGMDARDTEEIQNTAKLFFQSEASGDCCLAFIETTDWNGDFSPWPAVPAFGKEPFTGKAPELLNWLLDALFPKLEAEKLLGKESKKYIAGYSLAGLFALWAFLESDLFDGAASCSGSLWLPGWMEYMKSKALRRDGIVYLSLGSKEENTKNPLMATVGDNTRECYALLKHQPQIRKAILEWNKGGHFANPTQRLIKGMRWLAENGK